MESAWIKWWPPLRLPPPRFVHVPLVVGPDGRRLAKRHGDTSLRHLRESGVAAEEVASGLRAYAIAPGVIDTDMQAAIRASSREDFPDLDRFVQMKRDGAYNTPGFIADRFLEIAFGEARDREVLQRLPNEKD